MDEKIRVTLNNKKVEIPKNISVIDFIKTYNRSINSVIGIKINNEISNFTTHFEENDKIEFVYVNDIDGNKIYKSALKFILIVAIYELYGKSSDVFFEHSIDKGICFQIKTDGLLEDEDVKKIKNQMRKIVKEDSLIKKINVTKKNAVMYYKNIGENEKALNVQSILNPVVSLYKLKDYYNYFYTAMPYSTSVIKDFDIVYLGNNKFVLLFPVIGKDINIPKYHHYPLNMRSFTEYKKWIKSLEIQNVADINYLVSHNKIEDFIRTNELYLQKNILKEAEKITNRGNVKLVLMAGPSSSGKTTTCKKLALALKAYGLRILNISIDDYYLNQKEMPKEKVEIHDFESIDLIDMELLNKHLESLLNHEDVQIPTYNFALGKKEYNNPPVKIDDKTIILMEGNHGLNPKLLKNIDSSKTYKIYISPFFPLEMDRHNHVSTLDIRLIRRIVRDNQFRAVNVEDTLKNWELVRKGEEEYIFPFMQNVDSVLNTSLIYELGVLKVYVEPLLYSIDITSPMYEEARRLLEFLNIFLPITSEYVEKSSLLREFIGGSIFK